MLLSSVEMECVVTMRGSTFVLKTVALVASVEMGPARDGWVRTVRHVHTIAWVTWTLKRRGASSAVGPTSDVGMRGALAMAPSALSVVPQPTAFLM